MYLININTKEAQEGDETFLRRKSGLQLGNSLFLQETLPPNPHNWIVDSGIVREMTLEEITYRTAKDLYLSTKTEQFLGKRYRIEVAVPTMLTSATWPALAIVALSSSTIRTEVKHMLEDGTYIPYNYIYLNLLLPADKTEMEDEGFTIFDVEDLNPDL